MSCLAFAFMTRDTPMLRNCSRMVSIRRSRKNASDIRQSPPRWIYTATLPIRCRLMLQRRLIRRFRLLKNS